MADLIIKGASGAMKGLELLGYSRAVGQVTAALLDIQNMLNKQFHEDVKVPFHGGEAGWFDVEHILCKVSFK